MKHISHCWTTGFEVHGYVIFLWNFFQKKIISVLQLTKSQLYTLYLDSNNFSAVAHGLYVAPASRNILVQATITHQLQAAAEAELLKHSARIDVDDLYSEAEKAFEALSLLLGEDNWFFGAEKPTLFDASVFAYTHLLLDEGLKWKERKLVLGVRKRENLVRHRDQILVQYYES
jgi:metaxin